MMSKIIQRIIVVAVLYGIFYWLVSVFVLTSTAKIKLDVIADSDTRITTYYATPFDGQAFSETQSATSRPIGAGTRKSATLYTNNRLVSGLRIDPLPGPGTIRLFSIELLSHFGDSIVMDPEEIVASFTPDSNTTLTLQQDAALVSSHGDDPQLVLDGNIRFENAVFRFLLPMFLAIISALVIYSVSWRDIYAVKDISQKKSSFKQKITSLDGVRGFAALLVLADHTDALYLKGLGAIGVYIFFCLSGFLLSIPFVKDPSLITSSSYVRQYGLRRIKRILPMYYSVLLVMYLFNDRLADFVRHVLFVQGDSIFWSVPQEMFFYMVLPLVFIVNYYVCRGNTKLMIGLALVMSVLCNQYLTTEVVYLYGNNNKLPLWVGIFLSGVFLSYFYHSPYVEPIRDRSTRFHNICGLTLLAIVLLSSNTVLESVFQQGVYYTWKYSALFGYIGMLLLLFTLIDEKSILNRIMCFYPLRAIGIVGFSFYLLHPSVLRMLNSVSVFVTGEPFSPTTLLLAGTVATYFFAMITYSLIERPFIVKQKQ